MIAGYEPHRIAALDRHTRLALASLDTVTSSDIAADDAVAAVGRLRAVLTGSFVPAVAEIQATDPLAAGSTSACSSSDWLRAQRRRRNRTRWSGHDDIDLAVLLHIELTRQIEENGAPDLDDPFWSGDFLEWVAEFERRSRTDPDFVTFLAHEVGVNPLLGFIVAAGDFAGDIQIATTGALMDGPPNGAVHQIYRDVAIQALVDTISNKPAIALTLLADADTTERLLTWNRREGGAFGLDGDAIGQLFASALRHPLDTPERAGEAHRILEQLADLAHGPLFDRGFPAGVAPGITAGLIGYLPSLIDSLGLDGDVFFQNSQGRFETRLGSATAVVDLLGALTRDAPSRALLLATIPPLAVGTASGMFDLEAVNNYVVALTEAAATEQIEEEVRAARTHADWHAAIGAISTGLETALVASGKNAGAAHDVTRLVESGARWLVARVAADDLALADVRTTAFLLLTYGVSVAFLGRPHDDDPDDDPRVAEASELADEIDRLLDAGKSAESIEREIRNLRALVEQIGGADAMTTLDDRRLAPARYEAAHDADLAN